MIRRSRGWDFEGAGRTVLHITNQPAVRAGSGVSTTQLMKVEPGLSGVRETQFEFGDLVGLFRGQSLHLLVQR